MYSISNTTMAGIIKALTRIEKRPACGTRELEEQRKVKVLINKLKKIKQEQI